MDGRFSDAIEIGALGLFAQQLPMLSPPLSHSLPTISLRLISGLDVPNYLRLRGCCRLLFGFYEGERQGAKNIKFMRSVFTASVGGRKKQLLYGKG